MATDTVTPTPHATGKPTEARHATAETASCTTVKVRALSREFDGRGVLHDINFDIRDGEFVALLGRSGSGKSTLLRILARLDDEYTGTVQAPKRPAVAFQDSRLLPWKKVLANVTLGLPTRGVEGTETHARAEEMLAEVGLTDHAKAWPKTLSGGEAQRASLARALVRRPELLLMDEPFGALDALTRLRMHQLLRTLRQRHRPALLLVTHDIDEAILLADRVLVLTDGVLSLDLDIPFPIVGRRRRPEFTELRDRLLEELGVADDDR